VLQTRYPSATAPTRALGGAAGDSLPAQGPTEEWAPPHHERWEIETALDELKTHLRGAESFCVARRPTWSERNSTG
jgi:hypothetical protein